jgi:hypothetical protein
MGTRGRFSVATPLVAMALAALAAIAWAKTTTQTAHSGNVSAVFTFTGSAPNVKNPRLAITRGGEQVYNRAVKSKQCRPYCSPGAFGSHASSVQVADLENNRSPDVILELFSGGANCCFIDQVFSYSSKAKTYIKTEHNFAYGAALVPINRRWRFKSADGAFLCAFTDCADSGEPIQIWSFSARRFHNLTRKYPKLIRSDAARWLSRFKHHVSNGVGLIAAWAADEELLGNNTLVQSTLASEAKKGNLRDGTSGVATGKKFITALNKLLRRYGYEH